LKVQELKVESNEAEAFDFLTFDFSTALSTVLLEETMRLRTILLVEDNPDDVELTLRALKEEKIANPVIVAPNGMEALDYLFCRGAYAGREPLDLPAVMLLDLKLPRLDGLGVLAELRSAESTRLLPVVILTSSKEEQDLVHSYLLGCNSYVRKPVSFARFRATVKQLGMYWLVVNEAPAEAHDPVPHAHRLVEP
jgi:CheY-like chemotaxis protein